MAASQTFTESVSQEEFVAAMRQLRQHNILLDTTILVSHLITHARTFIHLKTGIGRNTLVHSPLFAVRFKGLQQILNERALSGYIFLNWRRYPIE